MDAYILTKIQWLLFMKICWRLLVRDWCIVPMIAYVCCWIPNNIWYRKIMSPSMDCTHDKILYMLCIFKRTFLGGCQRSMIKLSNVYLCVLKLWDKKLGQLAIDIYWLWMFRRCLVPICDGDIGNSLIWCYDIFKEVFWFYVL
jgi:hypothetical protein